MDEKTVLAEQVLLLVDIYSSANSQAEKETAVSIIALICSKKSGGYELES